MKLQKAIQQTLGKALEEEGISGISVQVSIPADAKHGDYTSNIAMIAAKKLGKNPLEVAEGLKTTLSEKAVEGVQKIDVVKPGFLNFWVDQEFIIAELNEGFMPVKGDALQKIMVEFTDPNPFKEFHIGHLYSNIVGESLSRLFEIQGNEVKRVCYQGDVGLHVAKSIWGMQKLLDERGITIRQLEEQIGNSKNLPPPQLDSFAQKAKFLGSAYSLGATKYEEDTSAREQMISINKMIYDKSNEEINELYGIGKKWSLEYFEEVYKRLGTKFNHYYFESEVSQDGIDVVKAGLVHKVFEESDGAVVFRGEQYGLHTRVFINSLGLPTYEAKELGLAFKKQKEYSPDISVIVTGNEINEYFKVLLKVISLIDPNLAQKTKHISHGMVRLKQGKMSSRTGNVVTGMFVINEVVKHVGEKYYNLKHEEYNKNPDWLQADIVGSGAVKYALLKSGIGRDIEYDLDEWTKLEGNTGPYLQYTYRRTQSILKKAEGVVNYDPKTAQFPINPYHDDLNEEEVVLLRTLFHFPEIIEKAADELAPSHVATYLFDVAQKFNNFYQKHKILDSDQQVFRVGLTHIVGETVKKGLDLLGIQVPQKM